MIVAVYSILQFEIRHSHFDIRSSGVGIGIGVDHFKLFVDYLKAHATDPAILNLES